MKKKTKLSPRARKKEMTGVNLRAIQERLKELELRCAGFEGYNAGYSDGVNKRLKGLEDVVNFLSQEIHDLKFKAKKRSGGK